MIKRIVALVLSGIIMSAVIFSCSIKGRDIINNPRSFFASEDDYIKYMKEKVSFDGITLNFVEVKKGDNYWKIARDSGINIDTLIGINIFWEDLKASEGDVVIVPSEQGIVEFVNDKSETKNLQVIYSITEDDIVLQDIPFYTRLKNIFSRERFPVAVFIRGARPRTYNMNANLAGKFKVREMFRSPLGGRFSSFFGNRRHPVYRSTMFHNGIDIAAPYGTYIGASRDGRVVSTGWMGAYGKAVIIEHDGGYRTLYGHMSIICARQGQWIKAGKVIGKVGSTGLSTGPHLHFTLWHDNRLINPMDVLW